MTRAEMTPAVELKILKEMGLQLPKYCQ